MGNRKNVNFLNLAGYTKVSKMRNDGRVGGWVALFIRDSINFKIRTDTVTDTCESLFIEISGLVLKR